MPSTVEEETADSVSTNSLLSETSYDSGSESGFYVSPCTTTVIVTTLVGIGSLLLAILVALIVMLQSCEAKNGVIQQHWRTTEEHDQCNAYAFQAEINNLGIDVVDYINNGKYLHDLNMSLWITEIYFSNVTRKKDDDSNVILVDLDDLFITTRDVRNEDVRHMSKILLSELCKKLQKSGWKLLLFTTSTENNRDIILGQLSSYGIEGSPSLFMRSSDEKTMGNWEYMFRMRMELYNQGLRIAGVISSRLDALKGPSAGTQYFKLPSPIPYN